MNWREKTQQILDMVISKIDIKDRFVLKRAIDSFCPFEESDYFAMKIWREEKKKVLNNLYKNNKNTTKKVRDFYDSESEF